MGDQSAGDITITAPISPSNTNYLNLVTGGKIALANLQPGVISANATSVDITEDYLGLTAPGGIGSSLSPIKIDSQFLEASTSTAGIYIDSFNQALNIGNVSESLYGLIVETSGSIVINSNGGSLGIGENVVSGSDSGDITLSANYNDSSMFASEGDIIFSSISYIPAISVYDALIVYAQHGNVTLDADRDIIIGGYSPLPNLVIANNDMTLTAGRDITIAANSAVGSDVNIFAEEDYSNDTGGDVSITAGTDSDYESGNITVGTIGFSPEVVSFDSGPGLPPPSYFGSGVVLALGDDGGSVTMTTGSGGVFTLNNSGLPYYFPYLVNGAGVGSASGDVTINADRVSINENDYPNNSDGRISADDTVTIRPVSEGRAINLGGNKFDSIRLEITNSELQRITADEIVVGSSDAGDITITGTIDLSEYGTDQLELVSGGEISSNHEYNSFQNNFQNSYFYPDIIVSKLAMTAEDGIGVSNSGAIRIYSNNLEAKTITGGIRVDGVRSSSSEYPQYFDHTLTIGGVNETLTGLYVEDWGNIVINSYGGTLYLADFDGQQVVRGGDGDNNYNNEYDYGYSSNITLNANSGRGYEYDYPFGGHSYSIGGDVVATSYNQSIVAPDGDITVYADRDVKFGTENRWRPRGGPMSGAPDNDVLASGDIELEAGRDVIISGDADVLSDAFSDYEDNNSYTGGGVTVFAGEDITIENSYGYDDFSHYSYNGSPSIGSNGDGDVELTAGDGEYSRYSNYGFVSLEADTRGNYTVFSENGDVTITTDHLYIDDSTVAAFDGKITVQTLNGIGIDIGSNSDETNYNTLNISSYEITRFYSGLLRIGNPNFDDSNIVVTGQVNAYNVDTISLTTNGSITSTVEDESEEIDYGSLQVNNLALHANSGIGTSDVPFATIVHNLGFLNNGYNERVIRPNIPTESNEDPGIVNISNTGMLTINEVYDLQNSNNYGTTTTLTAYYGEAWQSNTTIAPYCCSETNQGGIVFAVDTYSYDTLTANAIESSQPGDDIRVNSLVDVISEIGSVNFNAGDGIVTEENSFISAERDVHLAFGVNDYDGVSFIDLRGFITSRTLTLVGGEAHDSITLGNIDNIDARLVSIYTGSGNPDSVTLLDDQLSNEINVSARLGTYIEVQGFNSTIRIFETTTADTLTISGGDGDDTLISQPGVERIASVILDGGTGNDTLRGSGILVGGEGDDSLTGGSGNDTLIGDGGTEFIYGLTNNNELVRFSVEAPDSITSTLEISGLNEYDNLVAIDTRPATGQIYALAINNDDGQVGHLYIIDPLTGEATTVGGYFEISGEQFGFDFNPTVDRIRIVSDSGENIRVNPETGAPSYDSEGGESVGAAYTNNFNGATKTTLFVINANNDQLLIQGGVDGIPSPNGGETTYIGSLGVDADSVLGFDIVPGTGTALATLSVCGTSGLYSIDLFSGHATFIGNIGDGESTIRGITVGATKGNDTLIGAAGDDTLVGGAGDDALTGGTGFDINNGGLGVDALIESRDADFTITATTLSIGNDGVETFTGIEGVNLTGGASGNNFFVGGYAGNLALTFGGGSDTLDLSASETGVTIDLDLTGTTQSFNDEAAKVIFTDAPENFVGTSLNDVIYADALTVTRDIFGGSPYTAPGLPNAPVAPGDKLSLDGKGQFATVIKDDFNTGTVEIPGFANIFFDDIETLDVKNSSSTIGLGDAGIAFSAPAYFTVGKGPKSIATGDVNGDGFSDIVTANNRSGSIRILLGHGDGTFFPAENTRSGGRRLVELQLADIDNDGDLDIVTSNRHTNKIAVLENNGDGGFDAPVSFNAGVLPREFSIGDLNDDGYLDIAVVNKTVNRLSILINDGQGGFERPTKMKTGGKAPSDVVIADFNEDGYQDIAVINGSGTLGFFAGNEEHTFVARPKTFNVGRNPVIAAVADFNNDGNLDVIANHANNRFISVLLGNGETEGNQFMPQVRTSAAAFSAKHDLLVHDFNGDGNLDIGLAGLHDGLFRIMLGVGNGMFNPAVNFESGAPGPKFAAGIALGDFNGDGAVDVAISHRSSSNISVLLRII